jgi:cytochrome c oxidase subunit 2
VRPQGRRLPGGQGLPAVRVLAITSILLLVTACAPAGGSAASRQVGDFYNVVFFLAVVIFVAVNGALLFFVLRYRRRPTDVEMPPQIHGSTVAEVTWTVIPALIVLGLFGMSWSTMHAVDHKSDHPTVVVNVQGFQWNWAFNYGGGLTVKPPIGGGSTVMKVPINEPIRFVLTSDNVIHSFYLPGLLFKRDVIPGRVNQFDMTIDTPGSYHGQCAEFCGTDHAKMTFVLDAVPRADFDKWVKDTKASACTGDPKPTAEVSAPAQQIAYDKDCLVVPAGQPVKLTFTNGGGQPHNVAVAKSSTELTPLGRSGDPIPSGSESGVVPALQAGQYYFYCQVHPGMNGTYKVQ